MDIPYDWLKLRAQLNITLRSSVFCPQTEDNGGGASNGLMSPLHRKHVVLPCA
jgi:hypothetical protein